MLESERQMVPLTDSGGDTRYRDYGYHATLREHSYGAFLEIRRHDTLVACIAVGFFTGDFEQQCQIAIDRYRENELKDVLQG